MTIIIMEKKKEKKPSEGIPISWIKSGRSNPVPPSTTHCKNETKLYTIIL